MEEPDWVHKNTVLTLHDRQIEEHGGLSGLRDNGLLDSALHRPQNVFYYGGEDVDMPAIAASYAHGIATNHPFLDGNKRTALVLSRTFLRINGLDLQASPEEKYDTFIKLAKGEISEEQLTDWFRENTVEFQPAPLPESRPERTLSFQT